MIETSEQIGDLAVALSKAQGEIKGAIRDADNPFFNSRYADLASVWDACRGPLSAHGIAVVQAPVASGTTISVTTVLAHASGQWMRSTLSTTVKDALPQTIGSATTYLRRYGLAAMVGVAPEDDDGEAAQGRNAPPSERRKREAPRPAMSEIGRPDRPIEPVTDAEVAQAFPPGIEAPLADPRARFRAKEDMSCPGCGKRVFTRKDNSGWWCWRQKGGCGLQWSNTQVDEETGEVAPAADPAAADIAERARLIEAIKEAGERVKDVEAKRAAMRTYLGPEGTLANSDVSALRDLLSWLHTRAGA